MDFEKTAPKFESHQLARAFGILGECQFLDTGFSFNLAPVSDSVATDAPKTSDGLSVRVGYYYQGHSGWAFSIEKMETRSLVLLSIQGDLVYQELEGSAAQTLVLAKGLFHLGLLTPDVERKLNLNITAHQKLEWQSEYAALYGS